METSQFSYWLRASSDKTRYSLVDPRAGVRFPRAKFRVLEPKFDFGISGFNSVRAMDNVSANIDAVVTTDSAWFRVEWLGGTEHFATSEHGIVTLPDHGANWA